MDSIDALVRGTTIPQHKIEKLLAAAFLTNVFKSKNFISEDYGVLGNKIKNEISKIHPVLFDMMKNVENIGFPEQLRNYNVVLGDPDNDIKKPILK